jgi:alpha-D-ribose 1-methylphosphonate 5-triphosphate synthase subunit PhnL
MSAALLEARGVAKTFTLHNRGGVELPVLRSAQLEVAAGECVALHGPSGSGKSTLLKCLYANYRVSAGEILVQHRGGKVGFSSVTARELLEVRRETISYVSQFLRVIPRVPAERIVAEELLDAGAPPDQRSEQDAIEHARTLLARLNVPRRLWDLPPATFSGGEQQRVNIAHGLVRWRPVLLLDEPTASLDAENRKAVVDLIEEARCRGAAIVGIFHDLEVRERVATRVVDMADFA